MRRLVLSLTVFALLTSACGKQASPEVEAQTAVAVELPATCPTGEGGIYEKGPMGINTLSAYSDAVVIADVVKIGKPRWNSDDGRPWCPSDRDGRQIKYRDVTIEVREVIGNSQVLEAAVGAELVVMSFCDEAFETGPPGPLADPDKCGQKNDGAWVQGARSLLALSRYDEFPTESGPVPVVQLTGSNGGHWVIDQSGMARREYGPAVPLAALLDRMRAERQVGWDATRDPGTYVNPLGE